MAITLFDRLNESWLRTFPALPKRLLRTTPVGSFETAYLCGCWQMAVNVYPPALKQPTRVRAPASKGSAKKASVLPGLTPPHRF